MTGGRSVYKWEPMVAACSSVEENYKKEKTSKQPLHQPSCDFITDVCSDLLSLDPKMFTAHLFLFVSSIQTKTVFIALFTSPTWMNIKHQLRVLPCVRGELSFNETMN